MCSCKEAKFSHIKTFGRAAYIHIDHENRYKLNAKVVKWYFIGYGFDQFGYRFWNDKNKKILRHYDFTFDENVPYKNETKLWSEDAKKAGVEAELRENSQSDTIVTP